MSDKILIIFGPLADFSTAPCGVLKVIDGKVVLDRVKAFNRARRMLNAGANMFRTLRRGVWSTVVPYDWEDEGYWSTLREYVGILHQPYQTGSGPGKGADVLIEIFDGCSEDWMYDPANYTKATKLIRAMFSNLGDLGYVRFGVGNECNHPDSVAFVRDCVYPCFKANGRIPFSFGATYSTADDWLEFQKLHFKTAFGDDAMCHCYRPVHGVRDEGSVNLIDTVGYWVEHGNPICVIWSVDGVWDGNNPCDWTTAPNGTIQTRPSVEQVKNAMRYWMDRAGTFALPDGHVKYGFEYLPKAVNQDECSAKGVQAISEVYKKRFNEYPANWGKYPDDWIDPIPPPPPPPPQKCSCSGWFWRGDFKRWWNCLFRHGEKYCK